MLCLAVTIPVAAGALSDASDEAKPRQSVDQVVAQATNGRPSLVFAAPAYGEFLQHPFSFYRNTPDYGGERLYAIDSGNLDIDIVREHPDRLPVVMSLPDGYLETNKNLRVWADPQSLVVGRNIDLGVAVPDGLAAADLELFAGVGLQAIAVPFHTGSATFRISVDTLGRVVVATLNGTQSAVVSEPGVAPVGGLDIQVTQTLPDGSSTNLVKRRAPIAMKGQTVSVLWPGTITNSQLPARVTLRWSSRVSTPAHR